MVQQSIYSIIYIFVDRFGFFPDAVIVNDIVIIVNDFIF